MIGVRHSRTVVDGGIMFDTTAETVCDSLSNLLWLTKACPEHWPYRDIEP